MAPERNLQGYVGILGLGCGRALNERKINKGDRGEQGEAIKT